MTDYRIVTRHVRYWRGNVHKWSNVWPFTGTLSVGNYGTALDYMHDLEQSVNYPDPSGEGGGVWEIVLYDQAVGGVPVAVRTYFDPATPSAWIPYTGSWWTVTSVRLAEPAETALSVKWQGGYSRTGKPVYFRKWFHAVPITAALPGAPDVPTAQSTAIAADLTAQLNGIGGLGAPMGRGSRLASTSPIVDGFYGNHQMPRGRRKQPTKVASNVVHLPPGLLVVPGSDGSLEG